MDNRKSGKWLIVLGCCCVIAAAALGVYNRRESNRAAAASDELAGALSALMLSSEAAAADEDREDPLLEAAEAEAAAEPKATAGPAEEAPEAVTVNGYDFIGILSLPTLGIELAVIRDWSYPNLKVSACRYSGSPDGQLVILAHNYDRHFGRLGSLTAGDGVVFTDTGGKEYRYAVTGTEIKGKYELQDIVSGDWDLTLFTCTYGGADRVVTRCRLDD
jgi:sortase A